MKRLFLTVFSVFALICINADETYYYGNNISWRIIKKEIKGNGSVARAPYRGAAVTSFYDELGRMLTLCFHYGADDAEVKISKDGETIASEIFEMSANDRLECDFSMCESGEYTVSVIENASLHIVGTFYVF